MKKITAFFLVLISSILLTSTVIADDEDSNCIKFVYQKSDIGKGAIESGHYYTGPSGKVYLFPYWAQIPVPTPTPIPTICDIVACAAAGGTCINNICVKTTPTPTPTPTPVPSKANAFDSCVQCHKVDSIHIFSKWKTTLHQNAGHKSKSCSVCHNLLK